MQSDLLETSPIWKALYFISPEAIKHRRALAKHVGRISNFRHVLNVVFFLLGDSPASEFYVPTFRNTLFHLLKWCKQDECLHHLRRWNRQGVPKRRHIKFVCRGIAQNEESSMLEEALNFSKYVRPVL